MRILCVLITCILSVALSLPIQAFAGAGGTNVAKVGSLVISSLDVDRELQTIIPMQLSFHGGLKKERLDELKKEALDAVISRAYKVQYAVSEEIAVDAAVIEEKWQAFKKKYGRSFEKMTPEAAASYRADVYRKLLAEKAEKFAVIDQISVSDDAVSEYYQKNKKKYIRPKSFTASHIFVKADPADNAEEREIKDKRAIALSKRAKAGDDFYNLAYYESDDRTKYVGGSLGTFHANQVVPEFRDALLQMKEGEISDPVKTLYGHHVIKLDKVEEQRQLAFDEVATKIRSQLEETQREHIYSKWMDTLKTKYPIEYFTE